MTTTGVEAASAPQSTHYEVLGVSPAASLVTIKAAHRRLALRLHPDKQQNNPQAPTEDDFARVQTAWECLGDPQRKLQYDQDLRRREDRNRFRRQAATCIRLSEMDECIDDDNGSVGYTYPCRCGEHLELWEEEFSPKERELFLECPSCSLAFCVMNDLKNK